MDFSSWDSVDAYPFDQENDDFMYLEEEEMLKAYNAESEWIFDLKNMFFHCMVPSVVQIVIRFSPIILSSLIFQTLAIKTNLSNRFLASLNLIFSIFILMNFFTLWITLYLTILTLIAFVILKIKIFSKIVVVSICLVHLISGQFWLDRDTWMSFRGAEMILIMKLISITLDEKQMDFVSFFDYSLSVNTSVIGPWISCRQYSSQKRTKPNLKRILKPFLYAFVTLICSNCLFSLFEGYIKGIPFIEMYFQAFSFRHSNYFICYFTQFLANLNQYDGYVKKEKSTSELITVRQYKIEVPRSMVDVVTNWNLPMHFWLKKYVFERSKSQVGLFPAIFLTYFASSLLHGFDPNIILVLFSIGWFAYAEFLFRAKLSNKLSSCLGTKICGDECKHRNKKDQTPVKTMNSYFYLLNIYQLAYLGQLFYFDNETIQESTKFSYGISKWSQTYFSGHIISILMFLTSKLIMSVTLHTDIGDIKLELHCETAPKACKNFLALCASGYYDGCVFHRNIKGFIVQTGDPTNTGKGGKSIWGDFFDDELDEHLKHNKRGVVSMANKGPNTNGSQFFITYSKQSNLDMKYTIFAHVIDGLETLDELEKIPVNEKTFRPNYDIKIKNVTIHSNPIADLES